jgi:cGMP-dependent protein kinase 2
MAETSQHQHCQKQSSVVVLVAEESSGRTYALKRMRKSAVVQCPEHVFCEQAITRNTAHPFCIRQYASFQDKYHLYFLFDLMSGGDLMDVLVAEAKVIKRRIAQGTFRRACFAPKVHHQWLRLNSVVCLDCRP